MNWYGSVVLAIVLGGAGQVVQAGNMRLHGALVAEPCVVAPGDESIQLDFGMVIDKYLYANRRTHGQSIEIRLQACDLTVGKMVKVTFRGSENANLKGLLAINSGSQASGIAIGIETPSGQLLPLNKSSSSHQLISGSNTLTVQAYVQGEPRAIANETIEPGEFSAEATFHLAYE